MPAQRFAAALQKIKSHRQYPGLYARYFDLIDAVTSGDLDAANVLLDEIASLAEISPVSFEIIPYCRDRLGADYERFPRLMFSEFSKSNPMAPPTDAQIEAARTNIGEALDMIERLTPDVREEIEAIFAHVDISGENPDPGVRKYGGVTTLFAWGGCFMNIESHDSTRKVAAGLVHEVTHGVLFGVSLAEPLVWNDPEDSFQSPLRPDPRPMDGIYHATIVCGRMAYFEKARLEREGGSDREALDSLLQRFDDGALVIEKHAELSGAGRRLLHACKEGLGRPDEPACRA